jgi:hypothetical protein
LPSHRAFHAVGQLNVFELDQCHFDTLFEGRDVEDLSDIGVDPVGLRQRLVKGVLADNQRGVADRDSVVVAESFSQSGRLRPSRMLESSVEDDGLGKELRVGALDAKWASPIAKACRHDPPGPRQVKRRLGRGVLVG